MNKGWRLSPLRERSETGEWRLGSDGKELATFHLNVVNEVSPAAQQFISSSLKSPPAWLRLWGMTRIEGRHALAVEAAPGIDALKLCALLQASNRTLPTYVAVDIARVIAEALGEPDGSGFVTPDQLQLCWSGQVRLMPNYTSYALGTLWSAGMVPRRSLAYLPPESIRGLSDDARTSVYSVAVLLLMLIQRGPPYQGEGRFRLLDQVVGGHRATPTPLWDSLPPELAKVIDRAMAIDRDQRFANPAQLRDRLAAYGGREGETRNWLARELPLLAPWEYSRHQLSLTLLDGRPAEELPAAMEKRLLDHPFDDAAWAVLADHWSAEGNLRGELAEVQRRLETASGKDRAALLEHEHQLLARDARLDPPHGLRCTFHRGYVRTLEPGIDFDLAPLEEAMVHPSFRFLHTVKLFTHAQAHGAIQVLIASKHPSIRQIELPDEMVYDEIALRQALPRLETIITG